MYCVSLPFSSKENLIESIKIVEGIRNPSEKGKAKVDNIIVELRLDLFINSVVSKKSDFSKEKDFSSLKNEIVEIMKAYNAYGIDCIFTCRDLSFDLGFSRSRMEIMRLGITNGAQYVDVEYEAPEEYKKEIIDLVKTLPPKSCQIVVSYHNYQITPSMDELNKIVKDSFDFGADIAKIAVLCNSYADASRVLGLYDNGKSIVSLGMGHHG